MLWACNPNGQEPQNTTPSGDTTQVAPPDTAAAVQPDTSTTADFDMRQPKPMTFASADEQLLYRTNEFTFNLTSLVCKNSDKKNIILSPLSASIMLGLVMNGADGETLQQMQRTLGFEGLTQAEINEWYKSLIELLPTLDAETIVKIANSLWVKNGFPVLPEYIATNQQYFHAETDNVDMTDPATAARINQWAADNTNDLIKHVVSPEDISECVMILANALYFKGKWETAFDPAYYADVPQGQLLEMGYKGGKYCMDVLLPTKGLDARQVVADLTADEWKIMLCNLQCTDVWVRFPKFKLTYSRMLTDDLRAAGMPRALSPAAEFPHVSQVPTYLSWVKQVCYLAVDETGTEAAAVTIGGYEATSMPPEPKEFIVNRPFFLAVHRIDRQPGGRVETAAHGC